MLFTRVYPFSQHCLPTQPHTAPSPYGNTSTHTPTRNQGGQMQPLPVVNRTLPSQRGLSAQVCVYDYNVCVFVCVYVFWGKIPSFCDHISSLYVHTHIHTVLTHTLSIASTASLLQSCLAGCERNTRHHTHHTHTPADDYEHSSRHTECAQPDGEGRGLSSPHSNHQQLSRTARVPLFFLFLLLRPSL
jgi:hypothetical protein